jgi:hypothetical protein
MRRKFQDTLGRYRDNIVDKDGKEEDEEQLSRLAIAADVELERRAAAIDVPKEVQEKIFELQKRKQALMREMKDILKVIDGKEEDYVFSPEEKNRIVKYDEKNNLFLIGDGDSQERATLGEVLHDGDFGVSYAMDYSDSSLPRHARKKFVVESVKRELQKLLDQQILTEEIARPDNDDVRRSYESFLRPERETQGGVLAEAVVGYFLKRLQVDGGVPFSFETADVHQDVAQKIDFVLKRPQQGRGVKADVNEASVIGVQFTMKTKVKDVDYKQDQIKRAKKDEEIRVDDIVLVSMPIEHIQTIFYQWEERKRDTGKTAGGPVSFLLPEEKEYIVRGLFDGFFDQEEIESLLDSMSVPRCLDDERVMEEENREDFSWMERRQKSSGQIRQDKIQEDARLRKMSGHTKAKTSTGAKKLSRGKGRAENEHVALESEIRNIREASIRLHNLHEEQLKKLKDSEGSRKKRKELHNGFIREAAALKAERVHLHKIISTKRIERTQAHQELIQEILERQNKKKAA